MRRPIAFGFAGALAFMAGGAVHGQASLVLAQLTLAGAALAVANRLVVPGTAFCAVLALRAGASTGAMLRTIAIVIVLGGLALARPDPLGMGDVKLAVLVAVALGGRATPALLLAFALAGLAVLCIRGRPALTGTIPLAPFICLGSVVALLP